MSEENVRAKSQVLSHIGLYYPYIHFRDERWLKLAALYWPRMARIVPNGYVVRDSDAVRELKSELGFVVDIDPRSAAEAIAGGFLDLVAELNARGLTENLRSSPEFYQDDLEEELRFPSDPPVPNTLWNNAPSDFAADQQRFGWRAEPQFAALLEQEVAPPLVKALIAAKLAHRVIKSGAAEAQSWIVMHRELAWTYKTLLSEEVARRNNLNPTTHQLGGHAALQGISATQLALAGLGGGPVTRPSRFALTFGPGATRSPRYLLARLRRGPVTSDIPSRFALLAIESVVPADVASIPINKIVEIRRRHGYAFDEWRKSVDALTEELVTALSDIESSQVLESYLQDAVRRYQTQPLELLKKGLRSAGVETSTQALTTKAEIPAAMGAGSLLLAQPHLAAVAGVAVAATSLRRTAQKETAKQLHSPMTYLLKIDEELAPRSLLNRVIAAMRRAAGLRG